MSRVTVIDKDGTVMRLPADRAHEVLAKGGVLGGADEAGVASYERFLQRTGLSKPKKTKKKKEVKDADSKKS